MMYEVSNDKLDDVGIFIVSLPDKGFMTLDGNPLLEGDIILMSQIRDGKLQYTAEQQSQLSRDQYFQFRIWERNYGVIYSETEYSSCLKSLIPSSQKLPTGMLYMMKLTTTGKVSPFVNYRGFTIRDNETKAFDTSIFQTVCEGFSDDQLSIFVTNNPLGLIRNNGQETSLFSMKDISFSNIEFIPTVIGKDNLDFRVCTPESKCVNVSIPIEVIDHETARNATKFWVKTESSWYIDISNDDETVIYSLVDGTTNGPYLAPTPTISSILQSTKCGNKTSTPSAIDGPGWKNLPEFRNLPVVYWWGGGLPVGCMLTQTGQLLMAVQQSETPTNNWVMDKLPCEYKFTVRRTDPITGSYQDTLYTLVSTETGYGPDGQLEE